MPILGETAYPAWAYNYRGDLYTATWEINIPPSHGFAKVSITGFQEYGAEFGSPGEIIGTAGLVSARRRKSDGSDGL